jgi:anaerobic dimethyl sulfoxide reductase subunit C (anchor subunit)
VSVREWALVAFTLLMQTSVGVLLVVSALHLFSVRGPVQTPARAFELPLLVAAAAAALALVASLAHLGQPLQAWLAVANVRSSWLSREIAFSLLFTAAVALVAAAFRTGLSPAVRGTACLLALALGLAALYAMSRLYMVPAQPAWNRIATPLGFLATTVVLGTLAVVVLESAVPFVRVLVLVAVTLVALQLLLLPAELATVAREPAAAISAASAGHAAVWLAGARAGLALVAAALLVNVFRALPGPLPASSAIAALVLVFASEILGRMLFYASGVRI